MLRCLDCGQADIDTHYRCSVCGSSAIADIPRKREPLHIRGGLNKAHANVWQRFRDFFKTTNQWGIPINKEK